MAIIAVASAKGSPGVTTTCLALTLSWPRPVLLVEADPAGGDVMAGYVRAELHSDRGLAYLAVAARRDTLDNELAAQVVNLGPEKPPSNAAPLTRLLLPGVTDPVESAGVAPSWPRLSDFFASLAEHGAHDGHSGQSGGHPAGGQPMGGQHGTGADREPLDVIVDCGRLISTYPPLTVMVAADVVLLALRSSLRSASSAAPVVATLRRELMTAGGDVSRLGLLVLEGGEYRTSDLGRALGVPVVATMPWREKEAAALSDGIGKVIENAPLMRAARKIAEGLIAHVSAREHCPAVPPPRTPEGGEHAAGSHTPGQYPTSYPSGTYSSATYGGYPVAGAMPPTDTDSPALPPGARR